MSFFSTGIWWTKRATDEKRYIHVLALQKRQNKIVPRHFYSKSSLANESSDLCYIQDGLPSGLLEHLKSLIIRGGEIDGLVAEDALAGLTDLSQLTISTRVKHGNLPSGIFDGMTDLTLLNLRTAYLNYIPPNWFNGLASLVRIFLAQNNLQTLPSGLFDELGALAYVTLFNNPWNCSCELMWLLDWSNITGLTFVLLPILPFNFYS